MCEEVTKEHKRTINVVMWIRGINHDLLAFSFRFLVVNSIYKWNSTPNSRNIALLFELIYQF